jgi:hypothetical protein
MNNNQILNWCKNNKPVNEILDIPEEIFENITIEQANLIVSQYENHTFFRLPEREIKFFEWLKQNDKDVWNDIWDDDLFEPYIVSIQLLPLFCYQNYKGFPICELQNNDNYYFVPQHLADKESKIFLESAKTRYIENEPLTIPQWLAIAISMGPIDIWHFSYNNDIELTDGKLAVKELVDDKILVHLKDADHLSIFVDL